MTESRIRPAPRRPLHWDSWVLIVVALVCTYCFAVMDRAGSGPTSTGSYSSTIPGLTGAAVEASVRALDPTASSTQSVFSGRRSVAFSIDLPVDRATTRATVTVTSQLSDGAVNSVSCNAGTAPSVPLTVSASPALSFCASLPMSGAGPDTASWIQSQFSTAKVGYQHSDNHNGADYDLQLSQYGNDTINYAIYVRPSRSH